jgi:hypothetical protein
VSEFWNDTSGWPDDTSAYVFLARAILRVGPQLFPTEWTGAEATATVPEKSPPSLSEIIAAELAKERPGEYSLAGFFLDQERLKNSPPTKLWLAYAAVARRQSVQRWIATQCAGGSLKSGARSSVGGPITLLTPELWNATRRWTGFDECWIDLSDPFGQVSQRRVVSASYVYVERQSLEETLQTDEDSSQRANAPSSPRKTGKRGRRPGDGSYAVPDSRLVERMHDMIVIGSATSAKAAATLLVGEAIGAGSKDSKIARLAARYTERYR